MARLSREQSQARTRARLLDAAAVEFSTQGFAAASLDAIAERAGYSKGAVYSNFEDKDDLFLALLSRASEEMISGLQADLASVSTADDLREAYRSLGQRRGPRRPSWFLLFNEFRTYALRTPAARRRLAEHERRVRLVYEQMTTDIAARLGLELVVPASQLAAWIQALTNGGELLHELDPEAMPRDAAFEGVGFLFRGAVTPPDS
jgi:AcrR family transcriptional regulator